MMMFPLFHALIGGTTRAPFSNDVILNLMVAPTGSPTFDLTQVVE